MVGDSNPRTSEFSRECLVARYLSPVADALQATSEQEAKEYISWKDSRPLPEFSFDASLTAFAQLGALRLDVDRALISLIDSKHQYILAEATQTSSLRSEVRHEEEDVVWIGGAVLQRSKGVCSIVLDKNAVVETATRNEDGTVVIPDLSQDPLFLNYSFVQSNPKLKFYAGVPITATDGMQIGVYCIFDTKPRHGLSEAEGHLMRDLAQSAMNHLETLRVQAEFRRRSRLIGGIESFASPLSGLCNVPYPVDSQVGADEQLLGIASPRNERQVPQKSAADLHNSTPDSAAPTPPTDIPLPSQGGQPATDVPGTMLEQALSPGSLAMFTRAATIIRDCCDYDCVSFFYMTASYTTEHESPKLSTHSGKFPAHETRASNSTQLGEQSSSSPEPASDTSTPKDVGISDDPVLNQPCPVLGSSIKSKDVLAETDSRGSFTRFTRRDLNLVLGRKPRSRTISIFAGEDGTLEESSEPASNAERSSTQGSANDASEAGENSEPPEARSGRPRKSRTSSLLKLSPDARSFVILPLWDYERQRWFACCICSAVNTRTAADLDGDLQYLKIFGNNIMVSLARLDATVAERAKRSFVASISHELRSPLHGILGALDMLYDTPLAGFQQEMVDAVSSCSRTLMDTLEHVMDFARINSFSGQNQRSTSRPRLTRDSSATGRRDQTYVVQARASTFDLSALVEEVSEALWLGHSVQGGPSKFEDAMSSIRLSRELENDPSQHVSDRGRLRFALHIPYRRHWLVLMQAGAIRRIIMNVLGNALKYTKDGLVTLKLTFDDAAANEVGIIISVTDTGSGISSDFLRNHLFKPFSQEDAISPGSGLGLSIVKQIVDDLGGHIRVTSTKGRGTHARVSLTMPTSVPKNLVPAHVPPRAFPVEAVRRGIAELSMRILLNTSEIPPSVKAEVIVNAEKAQARGLEEVAREWFGAQISMSTSWQPDMADIIVLLEPSFKILAQMEADRMASKPASVLFFAWDPVELSALQSDPRITESRLVIEIIAQPIGPRKLGQTLDKLIQRRSARVAETLASSTGPSSSPERSKHSHQEAALVLDRRRPPTENPARKHANVIVPPESPSPSFPLSPTTPAQPDSPIKILIVDDNPLNLRLLSTFLRKLEQPIMQAKNGQEALEAYTNKPHQFALVLMDISMPVMNGLDATQRIRAFEAGQGTTQEGKVRGEEGLRLQSTALTRRVPIVALTGLASAAARNDAREAGMDDYMTKPIDFKKLEIMVGEYVREKRAKNEEEEKEEEEEAEEEASRKRGSGSLGLGVGMSNDLDEDGTGR